MRQFVRHARESVACLQVVAQLSAGLGHQGVEFFLGHQRFGLLGLALTRCPGAVGDHHHQDQAACHGQPKLQIAHAGSTKLAAASMSTATMRDTPCSCMVTPMSCSAISMAILLCEMYKNWVSADILVTNLL